MTRKQYIRFIHLYAQNMNEMYKAEGLKDRIIIQGFKMTRLKFVNDKENK